MVHDHFSSVAAKYAEHRPSYPSSLATFLATLAPGRTQAWDCGTGSGQAAVMLAAEFDHVVATDPSPQQLAHAKRHRHVEYRLGPESASGLPTASCDLAAAAQAAHWFDLPAFYAEVNRVLKPGGVVAVWGYAVIHVNPAIDPVVGWFEHERVGPHWPPGRELANDRYRTLLFPYQRLDAPSFVMERRWTCTQFLDYLGTWSAVLRCRQATGRDPIEDVAPRLGSLWGSEARDVRWPIHLLVGHVSK
jgi:SAM-dependent methyltransferase